MLPHDGLQYRTWNDRLLQNRCIGEGCSRLPVALGDLLRLLSWTHRLRRSWRNLDSSSPSSDNVLQPGLLWRRLVGYHYIDTPVQAN